MPALVWHERLHRQIGNAIEPLTPGDWLPEREAELLARAATLRMAAGHEQATLSVADTVLS